MTVENARRFIKQVAIDPDLRDRINEVNTPPSLKAALKTVGFEFTPVELDQAHQQLLTTSQSEEEAAAINDVKGWWDFLNAAINR